MDVESIRVYYLCAVKILYKNFTLRYLDDEHILRSLSHWTAFVELYYPDRHGQLPLWPLCLYTEMHNADNHKEPNH